tara:strand:+ start:587 stop:850 length:264 start_codon:yes stop_codon:yes gene_type:complete
MEEELNYLSEKLQTVENNIARDLDYGYTGEKIDDQMEEQRLLENIISALTLTDVSQQRELLLSYEEWLNEYNKLEDREKQVDKYLAK